MTTEIYKIVPNSWNGTGAYYTARKITGSYTYGKTWERFLTIEKFMTDGSKIKYPDVDFLKSELCSIELL